MFLSLEWCFWEQSKEEKKPIKKEEEEIKKKHSRVKALICVLIILSPFHLVMEFSVLFDMISFLKAMLG